ncbi:hypothetical protein KCU81_g3886, partial [Aureobasidium melanogenum]|uniref:BTB domain-containing protein n=1 Tax=Aureobasidium melanogenum (strain CBS 110374) TaxID=1043003 RepID=A0A074VPC3_AURM1
MSSKAMARQRIVPAIPHQLTIRRAKVVPAGKSDQQPAGDKGKSASLSTSADKLEAAPRTNGIEHEDAHHGNTALVNGAKDEQAKQAPAEEEPVAIKELAVNKELLEEKEKLVENKEEPAAEKEVIDEKKEEVNVGVTAPIPRRQPHHQDAQALPFIPKHKHKHSESLVFGGLQDSSSASPADMSTSVFLPPPPMSAVPPAVNPYDNFSAAQSYPSAAPPAPVAVMAPPQLPNGHAFAHTNGAAAHLGSISSSPSRTPSVPLGDSAVATPDAYVPHKHHAHQPSYLPPPPLHNNAQHLADYVLSYWNQHEFADYLLELYSSNQSANPLMLPVHGIIIARYPGLLKLINSLPQTRTHSRATIVHIPRSYCFADASAFADAIRYVYGGRLIEPMYIFSNPASTPTTRMRYVLSYLAAGHFLGAEPIVMHAYNMALRILGFNELETVLFFAACGWCLTENCLYGPYADQIVYQALYMVVSSMNADFVFDASAPEFASVPRLPISYNSTSTSQSRPDSRSSSVFASSDAQSGQRTMSSIRFGSATPSSSDTSSPNYLLSSALLSLSFDALKIVLEHDQLVANLGFDTLLSIAGEIVRERERRRVDACNSLHDQKKTPEGVLLVGESVGRDVTGTRLQLHATRLG